MEKTVQPKPRRGVKIIATDMTCASKPRRGARIIEMYMLHVPKPRRGVKIIESAIIGRQKPQRVAIIMEKPMSEHQKYHPSGVSIPHRDLCYNPIIPRGIENRIHPSVEDKNIAKNQPQKGAKIIADDIRIANQPRRGVKIIEMANTAQPKPRRGIMIIEMDMVGKQKTRRVDKIIEKNDERLKYHPYGVSVPHHDLCYNPIIPRGIENKIHPLVENTLVNFITNNYN